MVVSSPTFGFWEFLCTYTLSLQLGSASTSSMPVTQHNCRGILCEPQGLPVRREEGDEVLGPDSKCLCSRLPLPAVSQNWPREHKGSVRVYSELWHLMWCHVAKCGTAKFF